MKGNLQTDVCQVSKLNDIKISSRQLIVCYCPRTGQEFHALFLGTSEPIKDDAETCNPTKSVCDRYIFNTVITRARSLVVSVGNPFLLLKTEKHMIKKYGETGRCWTEYLKSCLQHGTLDVSIEPEKYKQQKCLARLKELVYTPVKSASKSSNLTQNPQLQPPNHKQCTETSASSPSRAVRLPENTPSLRTPTQRAMPTAEHAANKMPSANSGNRTLYFAYNYSPLQFIMLLCYYSSSSWSKTV